MALGITSMQSKPYRESTRMRKQSQRTVGSLVLGLALLVSSGGCHSASAPNAANFTKGITKHLADHPDCLYKTGLRLPYETSDKKEMAQLDSLVGAKLLEKGTEPAIHIARYSVTDYGQKSAPRFCYGFRHVVAIESSTAPAKAADGFNESQVTYRYTLQDTPVWAKNEAVAAAYPEMAKALAGESTATVTLAQTGVGWQVPE